jgi:hypothetical protein
MYTYDRCQFYFGGFSSFDDFADIGLIDKNLFIVINGASAALFG